VTRDIEERQHLNTAVSSIMELLNALYQVPPPDPAARPLECSVLRKAFETVLVLLSPFAPHLADELWESLGHSQPLLEVPWPSYRPDALQQEEIMLVVQVNGKVRTRLRIPSDLSPEEIERRALADEKLGRFLAGKQPRRMVHVPGKLLNIVV